ncbi:M23 family metallopeptidase [Paraburkholderia adhaesiva]|uniref:M23 family metallopeptidase n=1 Tax=Paraburkholderia adhaesiva TaxID=2883244 RepID=UPI001F3ED289|nr:M23 family metallopeptidase [Paraburkholderia adhaesiva]
MKMPWSASIDDLSKSGTRFVTHRAARRIAIAASLGVGVVALAGGIAIGRHSGETPVAEVGAGTPLPRHYVVGELGRLNASLALLDPRIERLTDRLAALREFDQRLRALTPRVARTTPAPARSASGNEAGESSEDGEGGPELPPRRCSTSPSANPNERAMKGTIDCMTATLSALEREVAVHEAAWDAFPGRQPVTTGRAGSPFGNRVDPFTHRLAFHPGVDLVAPSGTPILAAAGGRVIYAGPKSGYGNAVEIDHGNGFITRYGHASKIEAHVGQIVLPLEHIADVGSTGRSTGPHLHFEVIVGGTQVNPSEYLALFAAFQHG